MTDYQSGFGNGFETEALPGALPVGRNSPQNCAYGLYAEQLSGSPFTAPRASNERSWLYRIRPSVTHWGRFTPVDTAPGSATAGAGLWRTAPDDAPMSPIAQMRWDPHPLPDPAIEETTLITGVRTITTGGDAASQAGFAAHIYTITTSMTDQYFYNGDAEMLFVPEYGELRFCTEFGIIDAEPGEIVIIPRGVKMRVELPAGPARGYLCENYGGAFTLPERGPIGANCLANPRDFLTPVAAYEDRDAASTLYVKWGGTLWSTDSGPLAAGRRRLARQLRPVQIRPAPVLPGRPAAVRPRRPVHLHRADLAQRDTGHGECRLRRFPERWIVAEDTFRPPWYHMNIMSEFMGLIYGVYDAKPDGFVPGGIQPAQLHDAARPGRRGVRSGQHRGDCGP